MENVNYYATVKGPGLAGDGPFGGPPSHRVVDPEQDVVLEDDGGLKITVAPRTTEKGVLVERVVRYPKGVWVSVAVDRITKEA